MSDGFYRQTLLPLLGLFTSLGTILCCALPALLVSLGMGAVMAGLVSTVPWITALSAYKGILFAVSGGVLVLTGVMQWRTRFAPCPIDPVQARLCRKLRKINIVILSVAAILYLVGFFFAFLAKYVLL